MELEVILSSKQFECEQVINHKRSDDEKCQEIWDGILCWPSAKPGQILTQKCPSYITGFDPSANATKVCTENGWWFNPEHNRTWTNYSLCYQHGYVTLAPFPEATPLQTEWFPVVKKISQIGYVISLSTLILAFVILICNRKLHCPRNALHLHLFFSFIMRAAMALLKDKVFIEGVGLPQSIIHISDSITYTDWTHEWQCKVFTTFWQYFIMANYSWILVEGVYLHNLIFMALFSDMSSIAIYAFFGWFFPGVFVVIWAIIRAVYEDTLCWTTNHNRKFFLIIEVPIVASNIINLGLFINIVRAILIKLLRGSNLLVENRISRYRKWAKSTLVLMPLYGVHYALFLGPAYSSDPTMITLWLFWDQLFASSQGFCVALLYCFTNSEVIQVTKENLKKIQSRIKQPEFFEMWRKPSETLSA